MNNSLCVGVTVEDVERIVAGLGVRFCLDISHAMIAANTLGIDALTMIDDFIALKPAMYHLCDNHLESAMDQHMNIGDGTYDFPALLSRIPPGAWITLETPKAAEDSLLDFIEDVTRLRAAYGHE